MQFSKDRSTSSKCVSALTVVTAATLLSISLSARAQDHADCTDASPPEQSSSPAERAAFISVAKRNLARLDRNNDGTLTLDELEIALQDHRYLDEDAAAVSALFWGAQAAKGNHVLGSYRISGPNNDFDGPQVTRVDSGAVVAKVGGRYYRAGLTKLRNANRVLFASSGPLDGIWFNLLEKAYSPHKRVRPATPNADALDAVAVHGGQSERVLEVLTGHDVKGVPFRTKSGTPVGPKLDDEIRQMMIAAQRDNRAMVASMHEHIYAVVSFDAASNHVRIHNPYDNAGVERLNDGQQVQRDTKGFFALTLRQFVDSFKGLVVEQNQ